MDDVIDFITDTLDTLRPGMTNREIAGAVWCDLITTYDITEKSKRSIIGKGERQ